MCTMPLTQNTNTLYETLDKNADNLMGTSTAFQSVKQLANHVFVIEVRVRHITDWETLGASLNIWEHFNIYTKLTMLGS